MPTFYVGQHAMNDVSTLFDAMVQSSARLRMKSPGTLAQYYRSLQWYWRSWIVPTGRLPCSRAEVQLFLDTQRQATSLPPLNHRVLQALANHFWVPPLSGPTVVLGRSRRVRTDMPGPPQQSHDWTYYVPVYIVDGAEFYLHETELQEFVALQMPRPTNVRNIRYRVSVAHKWFLTRIEQHSRASVMEAVVHRVHQISTPASFDRIITETTRIANCVLLVWGLSYKLCSKHVRQVCTRMTKCDHIIRMNTMHTEQCKQNILNPLSRQAFNAAEVQTLVETAATLRDRCVIMLMAHTGLRRRAVAWLPLSSVWDGAKLCHVAQATEKGMHTRVFVIDAALATCLRDYITHERPHNCKSPWLFPSRKDLSMPISGCTLALRLKQHCARVGIKGQHVRLHGLRKFTVGALVGAGNRIEAVSKWLGHSVSQTTYLNYWDTNTHDISKKMRIPWL